MKSQAIRRNLPLTSGIGSGEIDRNSIPDLDAAKLDMANAVSAYVASIKRVCETVDLPEDNHVTAPWPSHVYFEDVNGQSQFDLVGLVLQEVQKGGVFERGARSRDTLAALAR